MATKENRLKEYGRTLRLIGFLYIALGVVSFFFPQKILLLLNYLPLEFGASELGGMQPLPSETSRFWVTLTSTFSVSWGFLYFISAQFPQRKGYQSLVLIQPLLAGTALFYLFFYDVKFFAFLVGGIFHALLALAILWKWAKILFAKKEKIEAPVPEYTQINENDWSSNQVKENTITDIKTPDPQENHESKPTSSTNHQS